MALPRQSVFTLWPMLPVWPFWGGCDDKVGPIIMLVAAAVKWFLAVSVDARSSDGSKQA